MTDMLYELGWKSLQSRRIIARLSMLYKFRNNLANVDNANLHPITYSSMRCSGHAYMTLNAKCDFYKYSFFPRTIQEWNKVPKEVAFRESLQSFKGEISTIY